MQEFLLFLETIPLSSIDDLNGSILESDIYQKLVQSFPRLNRIFGTSLEKNPEEFHRTIQHTLRALIAYSKFKVDAFKEITGFNLSKRAIKEIQRLLIESADHRSHYLPLIIVFHDIGRPFNKTAHSYESASLIETFSLLDGLGLTKKEQILISKAIEYHLLVGSIYSGESTYYSITSLCQDQKFTILLEDPQFIKLFTALTTVFTIFDIWGYPYGRIFNHYIDYYIQLKEKLENLLALWPNKELLIQQVQKTCQSRLEWRLAASLRIFQFVGTSPKLSYEYYTQLVKKAVTAYLQQQEEEEVTWQEFKQNQLSQICKVQLKYGLGLLQRLASGQDYIKVRQGHVPQQISPDLIHFWSILNQKILKLIQTTPFPQAVWNVSVEGLPSQYLDAMNHLLKLNMTDFEVVLAQAVIESDSTRKENILHLDFSGTLRYHLD
ncbi:MAG: hypothetical protein ACFFCQ_14605 [Promethearchaeota archaeon]